MKRLALALLLPAAMTLAGCGGHGKRAAGDAPAPRLTGSHPCPGTSGFTCSTLAVPLDHSGTTGGSLRLRVEAADNHAPRGALLFLSGGPGQPGTGFAPRIRQRLPEVAREYRIVSFDQRGTGAGALRCPELQRALGASDLRVASPGAVMACARTLGNRRRFYSTTDSVADIELLRRALGVRAVAIDGVSYGTYVAERYALAHPTRVTRLVLDSVVPHEDVDTLDRDALRASARVLRAVCREQRCASDPAADLAAVVRARGDGVALLDALVTLSVLKPRFAGVPEALARARAGDTSRLDALIALTRSSSSVPASFLSQGLHESTLCADLTYPWGRSDAPLAGREAKLAEAASRVSEPETWPFDRATAAGNGLVRNCLPWPPAPPAPLARGDLPPVPALLIAGDRDLSTPLAWARAELRLAPRGRLLVVRRAGHSVQSRSAAARRAVTRFLTG